MTLDQIKSYIFSLPFTELTGNYLSTGWFDFKRENLSLMNELKKEIDGLRVCELMCKFSRIVELPDNCLNKK